MNEKRKTKTSSAVKRRYNNKHYKVIKVELEIDLVEKWEEKLKNEATSKAGFIRKAITEFLEL